MSCVLCETTENVPVSAQERHGDRLVTLMCKGCGLVFNDPVPSDEELRNFYSESYRVAYKGAYTPRGRQIVRNFRRVRDHFNLFTDVIQSARSVLDVGAGSGEFLFGVVSKGATAVGIEPNRGYAEFCRDSLGLDVRTDFLHPELFEQGQFDFIRLNHVLEHLNDPVGSLAMIARFLKDDGLLYVEVPNVESYARVKSSGKMFHYGHIFNFNPWTLRAAAGLAGLEENAGTAERCAVTTAVFFHKSPRSWTPADVRNADNVKKVEAAIAHNVQGGRSVAARVKRPLHKLALRTSETLISWRRRTPSAIGKAILG